MKTNQQLFILVTLVSVCIILLISGCNGSTVQTDEPMPVTETPTESARLEEEGGEQQPLQRPEMSGEATMPLVESAPDQLTERSERPQETMVTGIVKEIIGNEMVLDLIEMPDMEERPAPVEETERQTLNDVAMGNGGQPGGGMPPGGSGIPPGGGMPPGGGGMPPGGMSGGAGLNRNTGLQGSGELVTLVIPVGVPITSAVQNNGQLLDIGDLYTGSLIQVVYDNQMPDQIIQVRILQEG